MTNTLISGHLALPMPVTQTSNVNNMDMQPDSKQYGMSLRSKRKLINEPVTDNLGMEKMTSNRRVASVGPNAKGPSVNTSRTGASGKKVMHLESPVNKAQSTNAKKGAQPEVSPKGQTEPHDTVRTKLRESLASALALVTHHREGSSDGKMKMETEVEASTQEGSNENKPLVCSSGAPNVQLTQVVTSGSSSIFTDGFMDDKKASPGTQLKEACRDDTQTWNYMGPEFQSNSILSGEDSIFGDGLFFKDELLQGNGLSWVSDTDPRISELKEFENTDEAAMTHAEVSSDEKDKTIASPETLALEIEVELFKLYGGVNKKYKEKGRSLLFNLKDRNNPELRERVMSGEIPPDRLCSMTAEELASKELSQWRIAKAEELDHMKVLPDSDVNMRRLVKKTHKGEYQVDLDPDVGASEEISPIISVPSQKRSKINDSDASGPPKSEPTKVEQYDQCEITIPGDSTDMQGLMVDDVKDLPPIVSLDEFMESLNKEPPFENLPVNSETTPAEMDKGNQDVGLKSMSPVHSSKHPVNTTSQKTDELEMKAEIKCVDKKLADAQKGSGTEIVHHVKQVPIWEGLLQLNISSMANFVAFYKSGEKANTKEWAGFFDIKGRVRLDAFDKFLQALPMSRSRAIMVSHFALKETSTDSERSELRELVDSYITDERLGFAEPAPGVELYLCPPRTKTVEMIINHLPKSYTEKLIDIDDGLIGTVVWRKVQIPPVISPDSSSLQKQGTSHTGVHIPVNDDINRNNVSFARISAPPPPILSKPLEPDEEDDDDVPPGFGPAGQRDDDDLPEFNFSGGPNQPTFHPNPNPKPISGHRMEPRVQHQHNLIPGPAPARQVDQMRELIQKYGQNSKNIGSAGIPTQPWNDDDDDIPEWQPQAQASHTGPLPVMPPPMAPYQSFQRPVRPPIPQPIQPLQPPMSVQQQGMWWPYGVNGPGSLPSGQFNRPPSNTGHLPRDWRFNNNSNNNHKGF